MSKNRDEVHLFVVLSYESIGSDSLFLATSEMRALVERALVECSGVVLARLAESIHMFSLWCIMMVIRFLCITVLPFVL